MENPIVQKIWLEIKNMKGQNWGYDGMEGENGDYVEIESVLAIVERYMHATESGKEEISPEHICNFESSPHCLICGRFAF